MKMAGVIADQDIAIIRPGNAADIFGRKAGLVAVVYCRILWEDIEAFVYGTKPQVFLGVLKNPDHLFIGQIHDRVAQVA